MFDPLGYELFRPECEDDIAVSTQCYATPRRSLSDADARRIYRLVVVEGHSRKSIAAAFHVNISTVKCIIRRVTHREATEEIAKTTAGYVPAMDRIWHPRVIALAVTSPIPEDLRHMVGFADLDEAENQRCLHLLEDGLRRRFPSMAEGRVEAAVARVARALAPPAPPSDADWETIRRMGHAERGLANL